MRAQHQDAELVTAEDDQLEIDAVYYTQKNSTDAVYGTVQIHHLQDST